MEELQRKLNQRYEGTKPRKVRFKLASSYSGRVLKHVYEDGQEVESPEEKYPHSFVHRKIPPSHLEMEQFCSFEETQREEQGGSSSVLDFGKIIIYTSNLRIIRAPPKKPEMMRQHSVPPLDLEGCPKARDRGSRRRAKALQEADSCQHCGGSGCAPCSLCHGSKLSMLANRFNESISDLRCQACYPHGLEKCQSCSSK
uniref:Glutaredoxin and cysteine rich domain containing 2 n=1 Tax=Fundulus heteroclitus TaxID=8078 RepID=A0A3Q2T485_FUNHE